MSVIVPCDYEGTWQECFLPRPAGESYDYNLLACFPNPAIATKGLLALQEQGVAAPDARLLGTPDDVVEAGAGLTEADGLVVRATIRFAVAGMVVGALVGAGIGALILAIPAFQSALGIPITAGSYLLAALLGAIAGSHLGLAGGVLGLDRRHAGRSQYPDQQAVGITMVGVRARDESVVQATTETLHAAGASRVQRLADRNGLPPCGFACVDWGMAHGTYVPCVARDVSAT